MAGLSCSIFFESGASHNPQAFWNSLVASSRVRCQWMRLGDILELAGFDLVPTEMPIDCKYLWPVELDVAPIDTVDIYITPEQILNLKTWASFQSLGELNLAFWAGASEPSVHLGLGALAILVAENLDGLISYRGPLIGDHHTVLNLPFEGVPCGEPYVLSFCRPSWLRQEIKSRGMDFRLSV
jgi:hypothetical protein